MTVINEPRIVDLNVGEDGLITVAPGVRCTLPFLQEGYRLLREEEVERLKVERNETARAKYPPKVPVHGPRKQKRNRGPGRYKR